MRKFMVERGIPGIGSAELRELDAVAAIDNKIILQLWSDIRWLTSFIADDKTYLHLSGEGRGDRAPALRAGRISGGQDPGTEDHDRSGRSGHTGRRHMTRRRRAPSSTRGYAALGKA